MKLQITADNLPLKGTVNNLLQKHLAGDLVKFLKYVPEELQKADVRVAKRPRWGYKVTFEMYLPKNQRIYSEETNQELSLAVTKLRDEVKSQIIRYKEKLKVKH